MRRVRPIKAVFRETWRVISRFCARAAVTGLSWACGLLSWSAAVALGRNAGRVAFVLPSQARRRTLAHLRSAYHGAKSDAKLREIARRNFEHFGMSLAEIFKFRGDPSVSEHVFFEGEAHLKAALSFGKGVILVTGHVGNWELLGAALARWGYPLHVVATPLRDTRMDAGLLALRSRLRVQTIHRGTERAAQKIRGALRGKEILAFLIDQDIKAEGVFVDFFGKKAHTPTGAARLAQRSGAAVVCAFIQRLSDGRHRITIDPPMFLTRTHDLSSDIARHTATLTARIEAQVRDAPEQWVWMHRRWKTQTGVAQKAAPVFAPMPGNAPSRA